VTGRAPQSPGGGSLIRLLTGAVLLITALSLAAFGFVTLVNVLEGGGYGTPRMRWALVILGVAGACLAAGVATLIWDIAKRYESPAEPGAPGQHR
jgi:hypothetical protein